MGAAVASPADPLTQRLAEEEPLPGMIMFDNRDVINSFNSLDVSDNHSNIGNVFSDLIECNARTQQFPLFEEKCIEAGVPLKSVVPTCEVSSVVMTIENCG